MLQKNLLFVLYFELITSITFPQASQFTFTLFLRPLAAQTAPQNLDFESDVTYSLLQTSHFLLYFFRLSSLHFLHVFS